MAISLALSSAMPRPLAMAMYVEPVFFAASSLIPNCVIAVEAKSSIL